MKKVVLFAMWVWTCLPAYSQLEGYTLDFASPWTPAWSSSTFQFSNPQGILIITASNAGVNYENFVGALPTLNLSANPTVWVKIRAEKQVAFELRLLDAKGNETNDQNPVVLVPGSLAFSWIRFDFQHKFKQAWPSAAQVDSQTISKMSILLNSGMNPGYTGLIELDEIIFGDSSQLNTPYDPIISKPKINQLGYRPESGKTAVIPVEDVSLCVILDTLTKDTVWTGTSSIPHLWPYSGEKVALVDFSSLSTVGYYRLYAQGLKEPSETFCIRNQVYDSLLRSTLKSFYYQRASLDLLPAYAGPWFRKKGHPDDRVLIHPSAATLARPSGSLISAPRGWYDAGDFGKYTVSSGITVWQLLSSYALLPQNELLTSLNIPESNDTLPDILNEVKWELDWLVAMQDADGGVYHKLTTPEFGGTILPENDTQPRYVTQKSTAATLNFAAVMARAARIYPNDLENYTQKAETAWKWSLDHPAILYDQNDLNATFTPVIVTGDYGVQSGNTDLSDEFFWAAAELYVLTGKTEYLSQLDLNSISIDVPGWSSVGMLGIITLIETPAISSELREQSENALLGLADQMRAQKMASAYGIGFGTFSTDFSWNSNGITANQAALLAKAYALTGESSYLDAALSNLDYVLGRNPLNKCFVTGFGSNSPQNIHHRISAADGVVAPVPGLMVNGPHNDYLSECVYLSSLPAFAYLDNYCSSATNEVAIYVNSALVYALSNIEASFQIKAALGVNEDEIGEKEWNVFPNPVNQELSLQLPSHFHAQSWEIRNSYGSAIKSGKIESSSEVKIHLEERPGIYVVLISNKNTVIKKKFVIE